MLGGKLLLNISTSKCLSPKNQFLAQLFGIETGAILGKGLRVKLIISGYFKLFGCLLMTIAVIQNEIMF